MDFSHACCDDAVIHGRAHLKEEVHILGFIIGGHHLQQCLQVLHGQAPAIEGHKSCLQIATTMVMKAVTKLAITGAKYAAYKGLQFMLCFEDACTSLTGLAAAMRRCTAAVITYGSGSPKTMQTADWQQQILDMQLNSHLHSGATTGSQHNGDMPTQCRKVTLMSAGFMFNLVKGMARFMARVRSNRATTGDVGVAAGLLVRATT